MIVAHADWGAKTAKQWVAIARQDSRGTWTAEAPRPVQNIGTLRERLQLEDDSDTAVLGFDFPIGLPSQYALRAGVSAFVEFLYGTDDEAWKLFSDVANDQAAISINRPFYPDTYLPKGSKQRAHLEAGLGIDFAGLLRRCELATPRRGAASPLFWTCGGKQVGKAALSGWELFRQEASDRPKFWPFDGGLFELIDSASTIVTETYPAEFYGHLGMRKLGSKRKQAVRAQHAPTFSKVARELNVELGPELELAIGDGFGSSGSGEDQFDAVVGLFGMLNVLQRQRTPGAPLEDPVIVGFEGWILGQDGR